MSRSVPFGFAFSFAFAFVCSVAATALPAQQDPTKEIQELAKKVD